MSIVGVGADAGSGVDRVGVLSTALGAGDPVLLWWADAESSSPMISKRPATRALLDPFFITNSRRPDFRLGCLSTKSRNCSLGSWSKAPNEAGAISLAQRMKPSQSCGLVQTFLVMSRERRVVETKPTSVR